MINSPIARRMIAIFNAYSTDCDPDDAYAITDADILSHDLAITRCNMLDDTATLHLALDDELLDLTLIAIYDRDSLHIRHMILDADSTAATIDRLDFYNSTIDRD